MVEHDTPLIDERTSLGNGAQALSRKLLVVGGVALVLSIVAALVTGGFNSVGFRRFLFAYLVGYLFSLTIAIGALFFVLIQYITRSAWSATVRRVAETLAATLPTLGLLSIPLLISVAMNNGYLYRWAQPNVHHDDHAHVDPHAAASDPHGPATDAHAAPADHADADHATPDHTAVAAHAPSAAPAHSSNTVNYTPYVGAERDAAIEKSENEPDYAQSIPDQIRLQNMDANNGVPPLSHLAANKRAWLNPWFFILRIALYMTVLSLIARWFWRLSIAQDTSGDVQLSIRRQVRAPILAIVSAFMLTFTAFDLIMSLDPEWYSTIFGVYTFAGCMVSFYASLILIINALQKRGYLTKSVTTEHFHDMGKLLFAFTFFWGYIAFGQYLLIWYAQVPETIGWLDRRGATTEPGAGNAFSYVSLILLFGHLLIPFAGLLSRHVKRNGKVLPFWAVWMLVAHFFDLSWLVLPEYSEHVFPQLPEIFAVLGIGGIFIATALKTIGSNGLRPLRDPRLPEALAFQNI